MTEKQQRISLMTPVFRVSFPKLFKAEAYGDGEPKFSVVAIVRKDITDKDRTLMKNLIAAAEKVAIAKFGESAFRKMRKLGQFKWPIRDGEEKEHLDGYGSEVVFFTLSNKIAPGVIGRNKEPLGESDVYAGCYARATVTPFAFDNKSKGVSFSLNNVQKVGEGEAFTQRTTADEDFDAADDNVWEDTYVADIDSDFQSDSSDNDDDILF
jgi:hypothetical protein